MARIAARVQRSFLRLYWQKATNAAVSLSEALASASLENIRQVEGGYLVQSASGSGHSTSLFIPQSANGNRITPDELADMCEELLDRYDESAAALGTTDQAEIYADMLDKLRPITAIRPDYTGMVHR